MYLTICRYELVQRSPEKSTYYCVIIENILSTKEPDVTAYFAHKYPFFLIETRVKHYLRPDVSEYFAHKYRVEHYY